MSLPKSRLEVLRTDDWFRTLAPGLQESIVARCTLRRDRPSTFSNEALAKMQRPCGDTTATMVAR